MLFSNSDLRAMIVPLFFEQLLLLLVGLADTFMVSFAGEAAVSGVSLVNMFVVVFIYLFTALASGGAGVLDFTAHAASFPDVPALLRDTAADFHAMQDMELFFYAFPEDAEKIAAVRNAGGRPVGHTSHMEIYSL